MATLVRTNVYEACGKKREEGSWGKDGPYLIEAQELYSSRWVWGSTSFAFCANRGLVKAYSPFFTNDCHARCVHVVCASRFVATQQRCVSHLRGPLWGGLPTPRYVKLVAWSLCLHPS